MPLNLKYTHTHTLYIYLYIMGPIIPSTHRIVVRIKCDNISKLFLYCKHNRIVKHCCHNIHIYPNTCYFIPNYLISSIAFIFFCYFRNEFLISAVYAFPIQTLHVFKAPEQVTECKLQINREIAPQK